MAQEEFDLKGRRKVVQKEGQGEQKQRSGNAQPRENGECPNTWSRAEPSPLEQLGKFPPLSTSSLFFLTAGKRLGVLRQHQAGLCLLSMLISSVRWSQQDLPCRVKEMGVQE